MRLLATLGAFLFSGIVLATPLRDVVMFGDSLSDNGNLYELMNHQLPPSPPYFKGRFSNGPIWIENLVASYFPTNPKTHLFDYAYGGAGVSEEEADDDVLLTLRKEINNYLSEHQNKARGDSLFVVWIGANNYLAMPAEVDKTIQDVNDGITHSLQHLVDKGAKHILVVNLPDLGKTPAAMEFGSMEMMTYFSKMHNELLDATVANLKQQYPSVEWLYFNMNEEFDAVLASPQNFGLTNTTGTCVNSVTDDLTRNSVLNMVLAVKSNETQNACDGYLFFDLIHPTAQAHVILAQQARKTLNKAGVVFSDKK
jgi:phospholipase/lecithinase/hemolysin